MDLSLWSWGRGDVSFLPSDLGARWGRDPFPPPPPLGRRRPGGFSSLPMYRTMGGKASASCNGRARARTGPPPEQGEREMKGGIHTH